MKITILASQEINNFLSDNALWIALVFIGLIIVALLVILIPILLKKHRRKKINPNQNQDLFMALGGKDNLISCQLHGSRLQIKIKSQDKIDQAKLKEIGIDNTILQSDRITLILNEQSKKEFENFKLD